MNSVTESIKERLTSQLRQEYQKYIVFRDFHDKLMVNKHQIDNKIADFLIMQNRMLLILSLSILFERGGPIDFIIKNIESNKGQLIKDDSRWKEICEKEIDRIKDKRTELAEAIDAAKENRDKRIAHNDHKREPSSLKYVFLQLENIEEFVGNLLRILKEMFPSEPACDITTYCSPDTVDSIVAKLCS